MESILSLPYQDASSILVITGWINEIEQHVGMHVGIYVGMHVGMHASYDPKHASRLPSSTPFSA